MQTLWLNHTGKTGAAATVALRCGAWIVRFVPQPGHESDAQKNSAAFEACAKALSERVSIRAEAVREIELR
jgi:hypothetical protein